MKRFPNQRLRLSPTARIRWKAGLLLGAVLIIALLTPHLIRGHLLLSESLAQSAVLLVDFVVGFLFFGLYYRDVERLRREKLSSETRLSDSFRYIGKANVVVELYADFVRPPEMGRGRAWEREFLLTLLRKLLVSVLKSQNGLLRFVEHGSLRTVTEFRYCCGSADRGLTLSNALLREESNPARSTMSPYPVLRSVLPRQKYGCLLVYVPSGDEGDGRLGLLLLNQLHLLYLVYSGVPGPEALERESILETVVQ